jgi:hypothetical protein
MNDVVVVGSGRSGSSLVAGLMATAGHHLGRRLLPANPANPRGFFEDFRTILVNEKLLAPYTPLRDLQRWLAVLPPEVSVAAPDELVAEMQATIVQSPWCRKDPRFCYTLPAWQPWYRGAIRVCVFREPSRTANSLVASVPLQKMELSYDGALEIWAAAYLRVLHGYRHHGDWLFVHYDQILDGTALPGLEQAAGARLDPGFIDATLRRASPAGGWPAEIDEIYAELCDAAEYARPASRAAAAGAPPAAVNESRTRSAARR